MKIDIKITTTLVGCLLGFSQGMIFDPFEPCLNGAQVDSILVLGWDPQPDMKPMPPPYRSFYTAAYQPGTCLLAKETWLDFRMKGPNIGTIPCAREPGPPTLSPSPLMGPK